MALWALVAAQPSSVSQGQASGSPLPGNLVSNPLGPLGACLPPTFSHLWELSWWGTNHSPTGQRQPSLGHVPREDLGGCLGPRYCSTSEVGLRSQATAGPVEGTWLGLADPTRDVLSRPWLGQAW